MTLAALDGFEATDVVVDDEDPYELSPSFRDPRQQPGGWYDVEQQSDEWFQLRRGVATASKFDRILTADKLNRSKQRRDYHNYLLAECFYSAPLASRFTKFEIHRGVVLEDRAAVAFAEAQEVELKALGSC